MKWLTEDRALRIAAVLWLIGLALAFYNSPVAAAIREALA